MSSSVQLSLFFYAGFRVSTIEIGLFECPETNPCHVALKIAAAVFQWSKITFSMEQKLFFRIKLCTRDEVSSKNRISFLVQKPVLSHKSTHARKRDAAFLIKVWFVSRKGETGWSMQSTLYSKRTALFIKSTLHSSNAETAEYSLSIKLVSSHRFVQILTLFSDSSERYKLFLLVPQIESFVNRLFPREPRDFFLKKANFRQIKCSQSFLKGSNF